MKKAFKPLHASNALIISKDRVMTELKPLRKVTAYLIASAVLIIVSIPLVPSSCAPKFLCPSDHQSIATYLFGEVGFALLILVFVASIILLTVSDRLRQAKDPKGHETTNPP